MRNVYTDMPTSLSIPAWLSCLLCVGLLVTIAPPTAAAGQDDPVGFLKARDREVRKLMKGKGAADKLSSAISGLLDFDELARRALDRHWATLDEEQRIRFTSLLKQLVERSYEKNLESTLDYEIRYGTAARKKDDWLVGTTARSRKNRRAPEVSIEYTLARSDAGWKVCDVTTDGVSLVNNYRRQFDRIIKRDGFDKLIEKMKARLDKGGM